MTILTPSMPGPDAKRQILLADIHAKWGRFSDADLVAFKDRDDLVTKVMARYDQDRDLAERDVDALLKDRVVALRRTPPPRTAGNFIRCG